MQYYRHPTFQSTNFCSSAKSAYNLLMRNMVRVVVLDRLQINHFMRSNVIFVSICDFLLFLGKLVVVLICGSASYCAFCGYIPQIKVH